jgi:hypothetical protein
LAPRYPAAQVEAQLEEIQQEVEDYPVQLQPEMVEQGHQEVQLQQDIEEGPEEVVFEDDEAEEQPQLYDGVLLEVDADGDIVIPPVVEAVPEPDVVEEEEPAQDAAGNDPDDSGDDSSSSEDNSSDEEDENEDENEEDEDVDIEGLEDDNSAVAKMGTIMIIRMVAMTLTMRMEVSRVMSIDIAGLSIMSTPMLVRTVCFVSCWKNCCKI